MNKEEYQAELDRLALEWSLLKLTDAEYHAAKTALAGKAAAAEAHPQTETGHDTNEH